MGICKCHGCKSWKRKVTKPVRPRKFPSDAAVSAGVKAGTARVHAKWAKV